MIFKIGTALILTAVILTTAGCGKSSGGKSTIVPGSSILPAPTKAVTEKVTNSANGIEFTGVFTMVNAEQKYMHFIDMDTGIEYEVGYTGATDIRNKYDKVVSGEGLPLGGIYNITCNKAGKAISILENSNSWERSGITGLNYDEKTRKITVGDTSLVYENFTAVLSNSNKINIAQIVKEDEVTLRGIGDKVYCINVDKGHGYITFTGIDAFEGGYVSIGNSQLFSATKGMITTTTEGTYTVELQKGQTVARKTVTVNRDETSSLDFSEVATEATRMGSVYFQVTPDNAIMTIDGEEVDYSSPVNLKYGTHRIVLQSSQYDTYTENIVVNQPYIARIIDMTSNATTTTARTTASTTGSTASSSNKKTTKAASTDAVLNDKTKGYAVNITEPAGAALYVDSVYIGVIPCSFDKNQGNKTVTLTQNGFKTVSYTIAIANEAGNLNYAFPAMAEE